MSDRDHGQMNVVQRQYSKSVLYLCWWHVLHAWQQHFVTTQLPKLWELLKKWIRVTDDDEFEAYWMKIGALTPLLTPPSFLDYITIHWILYKAICLAVYHKDNTIFKLCDTNMLVEA